MQISGWGRYPRIDATSFHFEDLHTLRDCLSRKRNIIARGLGRSYGDSALADRVVCTAKFNHFISFDPKKGLLSCQAGIRLSEIIDVFLPRGWFLPVTPGTQHVSVGGAIASDVHGKNHHRSGCFSNFVRSLKLMLPDGQVIFCSRKERNELFRATCGGMGLTGIILQAVLQLKPVSCDLIEEQILTTRDLDETFTQLEKHEKAEYSVAWTDAIAGQSSLGRSVVMIGRHAKRNGFGPRRQNTYSIPVDMPGFFMNRHIGSLFNSIYYGHAGRQRNRVRHLDGFFYPLDIIDNWNRIYGHSGFIQYQFVLPQSAGREGTRTILKKIHQSDQVPYLTVLKLLGPANNNYLSFPIEGHTLAVDFAVAPSLFDLLDELDRVVLDHGGRLYLSKDARMSAATMAAGYPGLDAFLEIRYRFGLKGRIESHQSLRLGI